MGTIHANCIATGVYATNSPETCLFVARDSCARVCVVENELHLVKYLQHSKALTGIEVFIVYAPLASSKEEMLK